MCRNMISPIHRHHLCPACSHLYPPTSSSISLMLSSPSKLLLSTSWGGWKCQPCCSFKQLIYTTLQVNRIIGKNHIKQTFVDYLKLLEKISFSDLEIKERIIGAPNYYGRFYRSVPQKKSNIHHQLNDIVVYTRHNHIILNSKNTKVFPFFSSPKILVDRLS